MITFAEIMETMNEKKALLINAYPDRAREVMKTLSFTPAVGSGQLVIQKKLGYNIVKTMEQIVAKGKEKVGSTSSLLVKRPQLEERPLEPMPKRQRMEEKQLSQGEDYTPSQSPLHIGEEQITREKIE